MDKKGQKRKRRNYLPTLLVVIFLWALLALLIYFVNPATFGIIPIFFLLLFFTLLFTFSTLFANTRRGVITAIVLALFIILRYFGVGNIINFLLLLGIAVSLDFYFSNY